MSTQRTRIKIITPLAVTALLLVGCGNGGSEPSDANGEESGASSVEEETTPADDETTASEEGSTTESAGGDEECFIHLFDADDFDESDDNFKLTEPGKYGDLSDLPGADQDWTDEADSAKVGGGATVTVWSEPDFGGESTTLDPGSEHPDLDPEPSSLEMTC